jgi:hypothetical protein
MSGALSTQQGRAAADACSDGADRMVGRRRSTLPACLFPSHLAEARIWCAVLSQRPARLPSMAFGQQLGPPASGRQVQELLALLQEAGHSDFRDARGPMGFTQRQAGGKFTRDEADALLERLRDLGPDAEQPIEVPIWRRSVQQDVLSQIPDDRLAVELRRRGWTVTAP